MARYLLKSSGICMLLFVLAGPAKAAFTPKSQSFGFNQITANTSTTVASQLSVTLSNIDVDGAEDQNHVAFTFKNAVGIQSSITAVYFDDEEGILQAPPISGTGISSSAGVVFSVDSNPADLPGGGAVNFSTNTSGSHPHVFYLSAGSSGSPNGINASDESLTVILSLQSAVGYDGVLADILNGSSAPAGLRFGLHVQSIGGGSSDSFVNSNPPTIGDVPEPASIALWLTAAIGGAFYRRRRKAVC